MPAIDDSQVLLPITGVPKTTVSRATCIKYRLPHEAVCTTVTTFASLVELSHDDCDVYD